MRDQAPEADSSTEAVCRHLDDYDLAGFLAESGKQRWLSDDRLAALRTFEAAMDNYLARDDQIDDAVRIASPDWHELRKRAQRTLAAFAGAPGVTSRSPRRSRRNGPLTTRRGRARGVRITCLFVLVRTMRGNHVRIIPARKANARRRRHGEGSHQR